MILFLEGMMIMNKVMRKTHFTSQFSTYPNMILPPDDGKKKGLRNEVVGPVRLLKWTLRLDEPLNTRHVYQKPYPAYIDE